MRVIDKEELAKLLYETQILDEDYFAIFEEERSTWDGAAEWQRDDCREQAARILEVARVAIRPK